jgi:hypothetical protein
VKKQCNDTLLKYTEDIHNLEMVATFLFFNFYSTYILIDNRRVFNVLFCSF